MIDTHVLVSSGDSARYPPREPGLEATGPNELMLAAILDAGSLSGAVLVQQGRLYGFDNALVCDLAAADPRLRTLVIVDGCAPDAGGVAQSVLKRNGVSGVRFMEPEKGKGTDWLAGEHALACWSAVADAEALAAVHAFAWNRTEVLPLAAQMAKRFADTAIIIDNLGNGSLEDGAPDYGMDALLTSLLDSPHVHFKFTDMTVARAAKAGIDPEALVAYLATRIGADRILWGSDVLPQGDTMAQALARAHKACAALTTAERHAVMHGNAARLFKFG